jgi:hypothetical protein
MYLVAKAASMAKAVSLAMSPDKAVLLKGNETQEFTIQKLF